MAALRLQALAELWRRYLSVWRAGWALRHELEAPKKTAYELAFQPAHLELVESPVHPAPRWAARIIVALSLTVLAVAVFMRLDIVAVAKGKLVPNARVKIIQPAVTGVLRQIAVQDGQRVAAGQLLLRLDATQAAADEDKARSSRVDAALAAARARALLDAQHANLPPRVAVVAVAPAQRQGDAQRLAEGVWREYSDKLRSAEAELARREAALDSAHEEIARLAATAPLARAQADAFKALAADRHVAPNQYLDKEQAALDKEHGLAAQRSRSHELSAEIAGQRASIQALMSQFRREQLDALEKANEQLAQSGNDETKARTRAGLMTLTSPVDGTVQQLAVHTVGGVVTSAQALMEIVPDDSLEVEATVENRDIGFVKVGQRAAVKVEAFPYTHYGMLEGEVATVSNNAVQDRKLGLTFTVRIRLSANRMRIEDRQIALTPGMTVTAEIKTGTQSVARYLLGPLIEGAQESMRER
jgi:hemolysin D